MRYLEEFRLNKYLVPYLALQKYGPNEAFEMSYNTYGIQAFYSTVEDLKDLENQASFVNSCLFGAATGEAKRKPNNATGNDYLTNISVNNCGTESGSIILLIKAGLKNARRPRPRALKKPLKKEAQKKEWET